MKRIGTLVGALALALGLGWMLSDTQAQEKKDLTIKQIMAKAHKGGDALLSKIGKELGGDTVPWKDVDTQAEELVKLGKALAASTPKKGDKASWDELTAKYTDNAKALEKAAHKEDKNAAQTALKALKGSCKACHDAHK